MMTILRSPSLLLAVKRHTDRVMSNRDIVRGGCGRGGGCLDGRGGSAWMVGGSGVLVDAGG